MSVQTITVESILHKMAEDVANGGGTCTDPLNGNFGAKFDSAVLFDRYGLEYVNKEELHDLDPIEEKMIEYMANEGIEFCIVPNDRSEVFVCTKRGYKAVYICPKDIKNKSGQRLLAIAHEIGHYLDVKFNFGFDYEKFTETSYSNEELIKAEVVAWGNAQVLLKALGYKDWTAYTNETIWALNTYIGKTEDTINHMKKTGEYLASRVAMLNKVQGE